MNNEQLLQILQEEGYPSYMIENTIKKLNNLSSPVMALFEKWCQTGMIPAVIIGGYTYQILIEKYKMKPIGAFLTLDWLSREPEEAENALKKGIR